MATDLVIRLSSQIADVHTEGLGQCRHDPGRGVSVTLFDLGQERIRDMRSLGESPLAQAPRLARVRDPVTNASDRFHV